MPDTLGVDIATGPNDIDPSFPLIEGPAALAQAEAHRVTTAEIWYAPEYECVDLRAQLSGGLDGADAYRLRARCERALRQDERVEDCDVDLNFFPAARTLTIAVEGISAAGPFRLVVAASAAQSAILEASAR